MVPGRDRLLADLDLNRDTWVQADSPVPDDHNQRFAVGRLLFELNGLERLTANLERFLNLGPLCPNPPHLYACLRRLGDVDNLDQRRCEQDALDLDDPFR